MSSTALVHGAPNQGALIQFDQDQRNIICQTICPGASTSEVEYFLEVCRRTGLNPILKEAHLLITGKDDKRKVTVQLGIDGLKKKALESGNVEGIFGPHWAGEDGKFQECLPFGVGLYAAKAGIKLKDMASPIWCVVYWDEFGANNMSFFKDGNPANNWAKMPRHMLGKVALSHALRFGLADRLTGVYTEEELEAVGELGEENLAVSVRVQESLPAAPAAPRAPEHVQVPQTQSPDPAPDSSPEIPDDSEREGLIASIKVMMPVNFPPEEGSEDSVNWDWAKEVIKPHAWSGKYGRKYPMLKEWEIDQLKALQEFLEGREPEPQAQEAEVTPKADDSPAVQPDQKPAAAPAGGLSAADFAPDPDA